MLKVIFSLLFISSLTFGASIKANGCDLSQVGAVELTVGSKSSTKADYKAIAPSGKNFHSILVGSIISIDNTTLKIVDIKANKRVKRKARTGLVTVVLSSDEGTQKIEMPYSYDKGHFVAKAKQKNAKEISFSLYIEAILCHIAKDS